MHFTKWLAALILCVSALRAQLDANALFQKQEWAGAAAAVQEIVKANPADGMSWSRLGVCFHRLGNFEESRAAFEKALANKFQPLQTMALIARAYVKLEQPAIALKWLDQAAGAGFAGIALVDSDPAFAALKSDAAWKEVHDRIQANATPCLSKPEYREFDFWVGEWDVEVGGQIVAQSRIEKLLDGCIVQENWMPANQPGGKSWNYFNTQNRKWDQIWMAQGNVLKLQGGLVNGAMRLEGLRPLAPGQPDVMNRITYTPLANHRLRQLWDTSADGGKTWQVSFAGIYIPKPAKN